MVDRRLKLATVVAKGNRKDSLESLAIKLAERIDSPLVENVAPLAGQLRATLSELDEITPAPKSKTDDLTAQRAKRREEASVSMPAAKSNQRSRRGGAAG